MRVIVTTIASDGSEGSTEAELAHLLRLNCDLAPDAAVIAAALNSGGTYRSGGGAAPIIEIKAVDDLPRLNALTQRLTCFDSFDAMADAEGGYFPTLRPDLDPDYRELADAYDAAQIRRGDPRRAYRGDSGIRLTGKGQRAIAALRSGQGAGDAA